ncbi:hypothetical protein [Streptomyces adelaidensis]|uniref:hypothetical protein n=1 Tax=Streptomyces adelaidensis TaxID=2796465 RepID=UPI0019087F65|nr:hypothetical protein [Streptomyces adelaidensis]
MSGEAENAGRTGRAARRRGRSSGRVERALGLSAAARRHAGEARRLNPYVTCGPGGGWSRSSPRP